MSPKDVGALKLKQGKSEASLRQIAHELSRGTPERSRDMSNDPRDDIARRRIVLYQ